MRVVRTDRPARARLVAALVHRAGIGLEPAQPPPQQQELLVQHGLQAGEPLLHRIGLEQRLLLDEVDLDDARQEVRE